MKMYGLILSLVLLSTLIPFEIRAQFPQSGPYQWNKLPSGTNNQLGAFGGGNAKSGSVNIAGQQKLNPNWDVRGKVGVDYRPNGFLNKKVDVGVGYNINKNTQIRGSVGFDANKFGSDKRVGVGIEHKFGGK